MTGARLSLVISTLTCGGAERVMTLLANEWVRRGNQVQLITLDREPSFFDLDSRVSLVQLNCEQPSPTPLHALFHLWRTVEGLRQVLRAFGPDHVVSFTTRVNVKALIAAKPLKIPVVISERTDPASSPHPQFWQKMIARWYPRAFRFVVQTDAVAEYYRNRGLARLVVIPNPVEPVVIGPRIALSETLLWVTVARLTHAKGIDLLLLAWAKSAQGKINRLRILGDGPERQTLETLARQLGIFEQVEFAGFISDKLPHWKQAGAFILSSRFEGFPNALCEAMAAGLPCVSFDCPSGPRAILKDGENGLLVPTEDVEALSAALDRVAGDPELRCRLGREAVRIVDTLGLSEITDRWERALRP